MHDKTQKRIVRLTNCDLGVDPSTRMHTFNEAARCSCSICRSSEASCEGLRYRGARRSQRDTTHAVKSLKNEELNQKVQKGKKEKRNKFSERQMLSDLLNITEDKPSPSLFIKKNKKNNSINSVSYELIGDSNVFKINGSQDMSNIDLSKENSILKRRSLSAEQYEGDFDNKEIISDGKFEPLESRDDYNSASIDIPEYIDYPNNFFVNDEAHSFSENDYRSPFSRKHTF